MAPPVPRLVRLRDAPGYLGMDRNRFNQAVRPELTEIPIGTQGIAFDRLDLDAWVDQYKACNGRPASSRGGELWDASEARGFETEAESGTSTNRSSAKRFAKALERAASNKPS